MVHHNHPTRTLTLSLTLALTLDLTLTLTSEEGLPASSSAVSHRPTWLELGLG